MQIRILARRAICAGRDWVPVYSDTVVSNARLHTYTYVQYVAKMSSRIWLARLILFILQPATVSLQAVPGYLPPTSEREHASHVALFRTLLRPTRERLERRAGKCRCRVVLGLLSLTFSQ